MVNDDFRRELTRLINRFGIDGKLSTPDHEVAAYLMDSLNTFEKAIETRMFRQAQRVIDQAEWDAICAKQGHEWYLDGPGKLYCRQCGKRTTKPE